MTAGVNSQKKKNHETANYHRTQMQKEIVIQRLREQGCRITKQRLMLSMKIVLAARKSITEQQKLIRESGRQLFIAWSIY